jgi:hypothetical protein
MCRNASPFLLQRLKGSMSGDTRDFKIWRSELSSSSFFLQGNVPKEIYAIVIQKLGGYAPSYATVKTG